MKLFVANLIAGVSFIVLASWFLVGALALPRANNTADVGAFAFPLGISILIIVCSVILIIQSILNIREEKAKVIKIDRVFHVLGFGVLLIIYAFLVPRIGYFVSTIIFFPLLLIASGVTSWKKVVLITVGFVAFAKLAFDILLGVPLP